MPGRLSRRLCRLLGSARRDDFRRFFEQYPIGPTIGPKAVVEEKLKLITEIGRAESLRDFGGLWGVYGRYLLEGAKALGASYAEMIDVTPQEEFGRRARQLESEMPITVKMLWRDFQNPALYAELRNVDVSLLYDVLMHQDNADLVIKKVIETTARVICVAQPVIAEELFALPNGCVNLQLYPEELKNAIRCSPLWPPEPVLRRFITSSWMWGQTVSFFTTMFNGYGWERSHLRVFHVSDYWQYAFLRFTPSESPDE